MELDSFFRADGSDVASLLLGVAFLGATAFAIGVSFRYATLARDIALLIETSRSWVRGEKPSTRGRVRSAAGKSLWNLFHLARTRADTSVHERGSIDDILALSSRLANPDSNRAEIGSELVRLLEELARPEGKSVVVFLQTSDGVPRFEAVARSAALSGRVIEVFRRSVLVRLGTEVGTNPLLIDLSREPLDDVRVFGVGSVLAVPMHGQRGMVGAIMIGLATGARLSEQRRVLLAGIAEHAALAFLAAHRAESASTEHRRERDFFLGLSHDLKSPGIRALYALRELQLTEAELSDSSKSACRIVEEAIHEQISLIGETLDFVRYRGRNFQTIPVELEVGNLVRPMLEEFRPQALAKNISLELRLEPSLSIRCDLLHARRIIGNLLSNAIKYTNDGGVIVRARSTGSIVEFEFEDSGIGVPPAEVESLFSEFYRASNTGSIDGTGIGLHVVRRLAEANSGYVSYRPGSQGSIFVLGLPGSEVTERARRADDVRRILLVEDDPATGRMMARQLEPLGSEISIARSLAEARSAVAASTPDLVVSDGSYGDGTFADLAAHLSETCPVLLVTGDPRRASLESYSGHQRCKILEKPVSGATLLDAVRALLTWLVWSSALLSADSAIAQNPPEGLIQLEGLEFECAQCARLTDTNCVVPERGSPKLDELVLIGCDRVLEHLLHEQLSDRADARLPSVQQLQGFLEVVEPTRSEARLAVKLLLAKLGPNIPNDPAVTPPVADNARRPQLSLLLETRYPELISNQRPPEDLTPRRRLKPGEAPALESLRELSLDPDEWAPTPHDSVGNSVMISSANPNRFATIPVALAFGSAFALLKFYLRRRTHTGRLSGAERAELAVLRRYFQLQGQGRAEDLKQSYRRLARSVHPDVSGGDTAEFTLLQQRYRRCESLLTKQNRVLHREHLS